MMVHIHSIYYQKVGDYKLNVSINGKDIKCSPINLSIKTLSDPINSVINNLPFDD